MLAEAWASIKCFHPRGRGGHGGGPNRDVVFHLQQRRNDIHAWTTYGDARLYREVELERAGLAYLGQLLTENRHGLVERPAATGPSVRRSGRWALPWSPPPRGANGST
jgi:hypothetical protein